jgi:hypothetical protein
MKHEEVTFTLASSSDRTEIVVGPSTMGQGPAPIWEGRQVMRCEWFAACENPAIGTVEHPTLGAVPICAVDAEWLTTDYSPTKMVPPMGARVLRERVTQ